MYHALEPLMGENAKKLILGTFPSPLSRGKNQYYGNPLNKFWSIIFDLFNEGSKTADYEIKKRLLFSNGIALWDTIISCDIEGASDSSIRNPVYNTALPEFIKSNNIPVVIFNGRNAYEICRKNIVEIDGIVLPSTSPANARMSYIQKLDIWKEALTL